MSLKPLGGILYVALLGAFLVAWISAIMLAISPPEPMTMEHLWNFAVALFTLLVLDELAGLAGLMREGPKVRANELDALKRRIKELEESIEKFETYNEGIF